MSATYRTKDGDMLDAICLAYYGSVTPVEAVLAANDGLAARGPVFDAGVMITLPDVTPLASTATTVKLWD